VPQHHAGKYKHTITPLDPLSTKTVADPNTQRAAYGIPASQRGSNPKNLQVTWGTGTYGYLPSDLTSFYNQFSIDESVNLVSAGPFPGTPGGDNFVEGTLDISYITGIGQGIHSICDNTNDTSSTETSTGFGYALMGYLSELAAAKTVPTLISMSLGSLSWDSCNILCEKVAADSHYSYNECSKYLYGLRQVCMYDSGAQMSRANTEFMKLGLRGTTIVAAAGDGGSHFSFEKYHGFSELVRKLNEVSCKYNFPTFPAASPYVLAVGGNTWPNGPSTPSHWSGGGSGFSWRFPMPDYQKSVVNAYLKANAGSNPAPGAFNASNRAYPDLSTMAVNIPLVYDGHSGTVGGTSASAPEAAGMISLINDVRMNAGLKPLGWVNPRLYQMGEAHASESFYDITDGNTNCGSSGYCCSSGFVASTGYDLASGFGSPRWAGFVKYLGSDSEL